jgi:hypothetical protein
MPARHAEHEKLVLNAVTYPQRLHRNEIQLSRVVSRVDVVQARSSTATVLVVSVAACWIRCGRIRGAAEPEAVGPQCLHQHDRNRPKRRRPLRIDARGSTGSGRSSDEGFRMPRAGRKVQTPRRLAMHGRALISASWITTIIHERQRPHLPHSDGF